MKRSGVFLLLIILAACQSSPSSPTTDPTDPTNPAAPSLTLSPASINVNAGAAPVTFVATAQNSTEMVTWIYSGTGSITPTSGPATSYTPPASVADVQSESLTAVLGSTGVTAVASIAVYPVDETPPPDPTDVSDPSDPTDASDPTDPTDPTNPDPTNPDPTNPDPTDPNTNFTLTATSPENGKIISADAGGGIDCGGDCTAVYPAGSTATLTATPLEGWEVDSWGGDCSGRGDNATCTLTMDADKAVSVTFKQSAEPPAQTVTGTWEGYFVVNDQGASFSLDLEQTGSDVTGTWHYMLDVPVTGTFDGTALTLTGTFANTPITFDATVTGDTMSGTLSNPSTSYPLSATRE